MYVRRATDTRCHEEHCGRATGQEAQKKRPDDPHNRSLFFASSGGLQGRDDGAVEHGPI